MDPWQPHSRAPSSSAYDTRLRQKVAVKKLSRPFQSLVHARRTYRELRLLQHLKHENVSGGPRGGLGSAASRRLAAARLLPRSAGHWAAGRVHAGHVRRGLQRSVSSGGGGRVQLRAERLGLILIAAPPPPTPGTW